MPALFTGTLPGFLQVKNLCKHFDKISLPKIHLNLNLCGPLGA